MTDIPANLIKLSVKVMVTSMETITRNMQEIQEQTAKASAASDGAEGEGNALEDISRLAIAPFFEAMKIPVNVFTASIETLAQAQEEMGLEETEAAAEMKPAPTVVPLSAEEAALEAEALVEADVEEAADKTLWQVGRPGHSEFHGGWSSVFDYRIGTDIDSVESPAMPCFLSTPDGPRMVGATGRLNIHFVLERDYAAGELLLVYDRWGAEKDRVALDGELLAPIAGAGEGKFRHVALGLGALEHGEHVVSLATEGNTEAGGHRIDYLKLAAKGS